MPLILVIVVLATLCVAFMVSCKGNSPSSAPNTTAATKEATGNSGDSSDNEVGVGDLLNPDGDAQTPPTTSEPDSSANPGIPDSTEDENDGYGDGWY